RYADRGGKWDAARDTPVTRTIVGALGGLPLAIELAAARAARTRLPLALLADELRAPDALARLNDPRDPSSGVRYSLRKTLLALSPSQRARFAALGLPEGADSPLPVIECMFVGVPAARDGVAPAQDDLEALVAYSLMSLSPAEEAQTSRVRLHPLVRELAREEWAQQPQTTQRAAVAALLAGVQTWVTEHAQAFDLLARDEDLIAGIFRTAAEQRIDLQMVVTSIETFEDYLFWRNMQLREELFKLLLVIERAMGDRRGELRALRSLMSTATFLGKSDEDQQYTEEALGVARTLGDPEELASSLGAAAGWAHDHGRVEEARKWYEEASPLARSLEPGPGRSRLFNNLGNAASAVGNYREAATFYERAVASARALGDMTDEAVAQVGLVGSLKMLGDYATARRILEESFAKVRATGSAIGIATGMDLFGEFALHMQDIGEATRCFAEALRLFESIEDAQMIAHERGNLAVVEAEGARQRGDDTQARQHYEEALAIFQPLGIPYNHIARDYEDFVRERLATLGEQ
ncbi:MAG TPA: tetratricopeptide repeat protein, partial [Ktedonobacterales bacterium]